MDTIAGKTAVITGGASGIGLALARRLAQERVRLVLSDIDAAGLEKVVAGLAAEGAEVIGHAADVAVAAQVEALAEKAFAQWGGVHLVFNNAGVDAGGARPVWDTPEKAFRWAMDVNFFGVVNGLNAFLPRLRAQGEPAIISATASISGALIIPGATAYSTSKAAVVALMQGLSMQLSAEDSPVRAQLLFPGPHVLDTNLFGSNQHLQATYDNPALREGGRVKNMDQYRDLMRQSLGREADITQPEDFAEEVVQSIGRGDFYVMPLTDRTKDALRVQLETMIGRGQPTPPKRF